MERAGATVLSTDPPAEGELLRKMQSAQAHRNLEVPKRGAQLKTDTHTDTHTYSYRYSGDK